jgi:RNA polymerase sigma factor (sigma-70 family)
MGEMQEKSDAQLLRDYAEHRDDTAFREIVKRHTDFVYSAALRQVESADLAADVAQSVFMDLARKAKTVGARLAVESSLAGWLHRATRYAALNQLRDTRRRVANETQAMNQMLIDADPSSGWEQIRPALDEALDSLDDEDREAVLLRYFKNQNFRAVGFALGVSDDTAQKRVGRAVERLREFFSKRKVTIGASGLAAVISANAVQAAPAGLAVAISTVALAGTALSTSTVITATKAIAMTTLQKTLVTATVAVLAGAGIYEARQTSTLRSQNQTFQQQRTLLGEQAAQFRRERDDATTKLEAVRQENERLRRAAVELPKLRGEVARLQAIERQLTQSKTTSPDINDPFTQSVLALTARAVELNQRLEQMPDKKIPELQFLAEDDWLRAAQDAKFDTDADVRKALRKLRGLAKQKTPMDQALGNFIRANNGLLPADISQLKPYFQSASRDRDTPLDDATVDAIFERYKLLHTGNVSDLQTGAWIVVEKAPVDKDYDSRAKFGNYTSSVSGTGIDSADDWEDSSH